MPREPVPVVVVDRVLGEEPQRRRQVVGVLDDPLVRRERHAEVEPVPHVEPREVGTDAGELGVVGIGKLGTFFPVISVAAMARPPLAQAGDLAGVVDRRAVVGRRCRGRVAGAIARRQSARNRRVEAVAARHRLKAGLAAAVVGREPAALAARAAAVRSGPQCPSL